MAYSHSILGKLLTFTATSVLFVHHHINAFVVTSHSHSHHHHLYNPTIQNIYTSKIKMSSTNNESSETAAGGEELPDPKTMRIREIKNELENLNVSCDDCFDKESLCVRLMDARSGKVKGSQPKTNNSSDSNEATSTSKPETKPKQSNFDKEGKLEELRSLRVKELRTLCAQNNIRWAQMIEKEELVQALIIHYEKCAGFSPSGTIVPCKVSTIAEDSILETELFSGTTTTAPLMLDVFATWCGPCKLMAPQLDDAALELGDSVRVAKIDSDLHPEWSSKLNVNGLPTIIVFDGATGKELQRVEGALMKDDLIKLGRSHVH